MGIWRSSKEACYLEIWRKTPNESVESMQVVASGVMKVFQGIYLYKAAWFTSLNHMQVYKFGRNTN